MSCCKRCVGTLRDVLCRAAEHQGLLQQAVQTADVSDVKRLLQHIPVKRRYATCLGPKGQTLLRYACGCKAISIIRWLLSENSRAYINKPDHDGRTVLMAACEDGNSQVVQELLQHKPKLSVINQEGNTALHIACKSGHQSVVNMLLAKRANSMTPDKQLMTPLMVAALGGHEGCVYALLKKTTAGFVDLQDSEGRTALFLAVCNRHAGTAKRLMDFAADPEMEAHTGRNCHRMAALNRDAEMQRILKTHDFFYPATWSKELCLSWAGKGISKPIRKAKD